MRLEELEVGTVAFLDPSKLQSAFVLKNPHVFRVGPFVCIAKGNGESAWLAITSRQHRTGLRLLIKPRWKHGGSPRWRHEENYIVDVRELYIGPNELFVSASDCEDSRYDHCQRPSVSVGGVLEIIKEVNRVTWNRHAERLEEMAPFVLRKEKA